MSRKGVYKSSNSKVSDWLQLPLCFSHHQGAEGVHTLGVNAWETTFGAQSSFVDSLCEEFNINLWQLASEKKEKKYKRSHKIMRREYE